MTTNAENDRRIDYIEFNVGDIERSKRFYGQAFGWTFTDYGPEYCAFEDGRLGGGFTIGEVNGAGGPLIILYASDLVDTQRRIEVAGGSIVKPAYDFPGGSRFHFADPDGYQLAVWTERDEAPTQP
ncbi:MAG: VOC family protein [Thermomicrobiales bacterium]